MNLTSHLLWVSGVTTQKKSHQREGLNRKFQCLNKTMFTWMYWPDNWLMHSFLYLNYRQQRDLTGNTTSVWVWVSGTTSSPKNHKLTRQGSLVTCCLCVQVTPVLSWRCCPSAWCPAVRGPPSSVTCSARCSTPSTATPHGRWISVRDLQGPRWLWVSQFPHSVQSLSDLWN